MSQPAQQQEVPGIQSKMKPVPDCGEESYKGSGKLTGKIAVITGGDSGIGRAVAIAYAREGADVLISYLSEDSDAKEARLAMWTGRSPRRIVKGDVSDPQHCRDIIKTAVDELGGIDILVSNAAYQMTHETSMRSPTMSGTTPSTSTSAPCSSLQGGRATYEAGLVDHRQLVGELRHAHPTLAPYAATKAAIANFCASLAQMLGDKGIRVNSVAPGPIWTPLIPATMPEEKVENFGENTPLGRPGQPVELAPVYVLLASDDGSYVSGARVAVTGGKPVL